MRQRTIKTEKMYMTTAFLISLVPRAIYMLFMLPVVQQRDEVVAFAGAALTAGYDWSEIASSSGTYYGIGYTALFGPLLRAVDQPIIFYRIVLLVSCVLLAMPAVISFLILHRYLEVENKGICLAAGVLCSYFTCEMGTVSLNEPMLILTVWLAVYLFCLIAGTEKKKVYFTMLLLLDITYALTLHTRASTIWIALIVTIIASILLYQSIPVSLPVFIVGGTVGWFGIHRVISIVQDIIWKVSSATKPVTGTTVLGAGTSLTQLMALETWQPWLSIIVGQINTMMIYTGGFALCCFCVLAAYIVKGQISRRECHVEEDDRSERLITLITVFGISAVIMTMGAQSLLWLQDCTAAFIDGYGSRMYGMRAITYLRYFMCYTGPLAMCGIAVLYKQKKLSVHCCVCIALSALVLHSFWIFCILPYIYQSNDAQHSFICLTFQKWYEDAHLFTFFAGSIYLVFFLIVTVVLLMKGKMKAALWITAGFLIFETGGTLAAHIEKSAALFGTGDSGYVLIEYMEYLDCYEPEIYVVERDMSYIYQMLLPDRHIHYGMPDDDVEEALVFDYIPNPISRKADAYAILDENEYMYVIGEKSREAVVEAGVVLNDCEKKEGR